jgi:uncharacterized protein YdiU (UPF0061 family)
VGSEADDVGLVQNLLGIMAENAADFTLTFRRLAEAAADPAKDIAVRSLFKTPETLDSWLKTWRGRFKPGAAESMRAVNPAFIPRNHMVEEALTAATALSDFAPFERLLEVITRPFDDQPGREVYTLPPRPEQVVHETFCGT